MPRMLRVSLFLPEALLDGLERLKVQHGTPQAESIRRAVTAYLAAKGVTRRTVTARVAKRRKT